MNEEVVEALVSALEGGGVRVPELSPSLALDELVESSLRAGQRFNQFWQPGEADFKALSKVAKQAQEDWTSGLVTAKRWWASTLKALLDALEGALRRAGLGAALCAEYDPSLQLDLLGLSLKGLAEPILDLGCGPRARLVRWLREKGLEAYGVERALPCQKEEWLSSGDWLEAKLDQRWGTILSHMGFSNHLLHLRLKKDDLVQRYLDRYQEILSALKVGGVWAYAPGLPFVEEQLPRNQFQVIKRVDERLWNHKVATKLSEAYGQNVLYGVRVVKGVGSREGEQEHPR